MPKLPPIRTLPDEPLELPLMTADGTFHVYRIAPASAEAWFRFSALGQAFENVGAEKPVSDADQKRVDELSELGVAGLHIATLGADVVQAMLDDGVSSADFRRAHTTALIWHISGGDEERAAAAWESGKQEEPEPTTPSISTPTAPANGTKRRRPSSSTTTSLPTSSEGSVLKSA